ncbi:MAG: aminotransferase class I/II-fold pyridoxal phosphate-dependent enzyme [Candidatus Riflebacteria bacterium]|nr:aminotransferase class I/II-fold pyridoxal phosphate-dependent enzyme [Candidatus Riflebacteria bacterium]
MKNAFLKEIETREALADFIRLSNKFSMDLKCREFEQSFAKFQGRQHAVLVNSGASANLLLLQALKNLGRLHDGDKVGFSAVTWSTNTMPIMQLGLQPVPVDCEPTTLNSMSHNLIEALKMDDLKAFFITNALGFTGDLAEIRRICDNKGIILLEDNCESLGTELPEGRAGNFGLASTFSFFVAHHMSTIEGGMICTDDDDLAEMLTISRANGWDRNLSAVQQQKWRSKFDIKGQFEAKYAFYELGFNLRPTEITGFLGLYQLQFLAENISLRQENYIHIEEFIKKNSHFITLDRSHISLLSSFAMPILCKTPELRDYYLGQFSGAGIEIRPVIAGNMVKQPFFKKYVSREYSLPGADLIHDCGFYCGNYPELTQSDLETISSCLIS